MEQFKSASVGIHTKILHNNYFINIKFLFKMIILLILIVKKKKEKCFELQSVLNKMFLIKMSSIFVECEKLR